MPCRRPWCQPTTRSILTATIPSRALPAHRAAPEGRPVAKPSQCHRGESSQHGGGGAALLPSGAAPTGSREHRAMLIRLSLQLGIILALVVAVVTTAEQPGGGPPLAIAQTADSDSCHGDELMTFAPTEPTV